MSFDPQLTEVIGGYKLERVLGRGGMGTVYLGKHHLLGRLAAIKVLDPELAGHEDLVSRFFHEAKVVNDVRHPNIVDVIDFVRTETPKRVAFVMEYLEGDALDRHVKVRGALSVTQTANALHQVVGGLQVVHGIGVIHRDLKPANLRFTRADIGDCSYVPTIKILDFGIAKAGSAAVGHKTQTGLVLGTPGYMAPEQVSGDAVSPATDVYAIGEILYELVTGQRLFEGTNSQLLRLKLAASPPVITLPGDLGARRELATLIRACLAGEPNDRPTTDQLLVELKALAQAGGDVAVASPLRRSSVSDPSIPIATSDPAMRATPYRPSTRSTPTPMPVVSGDFTPPIPTPAAEAAFDALHGGRTLTPSESVYQPPPKSNKTVIAAIVAVILMAIGGGLLFIRDNGIVVKPDEPITERPAERPLVDEPAKVAGADLVAERAVEKVAERSVEKVTEKPVEKVAEKAVEKVAEPPAEPPKAKAKAKPIGTTVKPVPPPPIAPPAEPVAGEIEINAWTTAGRRVGAKVEIDGRPIDKPAPLKIRAAPGTRRITVEAAGHPPKTREVVVKAGATTKVDVVVDLK